MSRRATALNPDSSSDARTARVAHSRPRRQLRCRRRALAQTLLVIASSVAVSGACHAALVAIDVAARENIADGASFGAAGAFEKISGTMRFAVDPELPVNRNVADIGLAPVQATGLVEFEADFYLIKPKQAGRGNGTLLFEVSNRGNKGLLRMFNGAPGLRDPRSASDFGDGFLLQQGYTLLWVGWQHDPPAESHLLRVRPPVAMRDGVPVAGPVRSDFVVRERTSFHSLADRNHEPYPVADRRHEANRLTVRDAPLAPRSVIPRDQWQFARVENGRIVRSDGHILLDGGFEPHKIYELVYWGTNARLTGLGLAAIRDAVTALKHEGAEPLDIGTEAIRRALAFGVSQSGRLLRAFLYDGFNADERDRRVFDGMIVHIAGGARGSFNHRFAQPSRASWSYFYPISVFPYADIEQEDPATGRRAGLLTGIEPQHLPKIFYTNSSNEYWRGTAALTHASLDGSTDLDELDNVRRFLFAGTQHVAVGFPPRRSTGQQLGNPNSYAWFLRALLVALNDWTAIGTPPPESRHPTLVDDTLVPFEKLRFPSLPNAPAPRHLNAARHLDFGHDFDRTRIIELEPPKVGDARPILLPRVDADGNEIAGLRSPLQYVPLATFTGWSLFDPSYGPEDELVSLQGSYIPFPATREDARKVGDPRRSIMERYSGRDDYLRLVRAHAAALADQRYLLEDDIEAIVAEAGRHWDFLMN